MFQDFLAKEASSLWCRNLNSLLSLVYILNDATGSYWFDYIVVVTVSIKQVVKHLLVKGSFILWCRKHNSLFSLIYVLEDFSPFLAGWGVWGSEEDLVTI